MQRFATIDADGRATGFYDDTVNPAIPADAIPVTDEVWRAWIADTHGQRWDGAALAPFVAPPRALRVRSVPPVALRKALRRTPAPSGGGDALAHVLAALAQPGMEEARDDFEFMVRAERSDMLALGAALGFTEADVDGALALAATFADPRDIGWEPASP